MGLLRGIWRSTKVGRAIDTIRNITDEGSFVDGVKRTLKEDFTEDNLIGKVIYDSGKHDGKKEGYVEASYEYKKKLIMQADEFLKHALEISVPKVKIAMLFRLAFLEGQKRYELFKKYPIKKVYVFSKRLNCAKNAEFEKYKSNAIAFAWFIWEVGYTGITQLQWIL